MPYEVLPGLVEDPHADADDHGDHPRLPWRWFRPENELDSGGIGEEKDQEDVDNHGEDCNLKDKEMPELGR